MGLVEVVYLVFLARLFVPVSTSWQQYPHRCGHLIFRTQFMQLYFRFSMFTTLKVGTGSLASPGFWIINVYH
jgi:hypothetical protein